MASTSITSFSKDYSNKRFSLSISGNNNYTFYFSPSDLNSSFNDSVSYNSDAIMVGTATYSIDDLLKIAKNIYPNFQLPF